jgi:hypothetical protein
MISSSPLCKPSRQGAFTPAVTHCLNKASSVSRINCKRSEKIGISDLIIHKEAPPQELESFVETISGAKAGQGQEVATALRRENIKLIDIGLLDYSVFSGLESAVSHFMQGKEEAAIWWQLILRPAEAD